VKAAKESYENRNGILIRSFEGLPGEGVAVPR
jgi:hypothetical protein